MTDCQLLSDRMASVARGDSSWTDAERDHLARCEGCREEWRVVGVTIRAGARTPALDPALVAAGVRGRLAAHRRDLRLIRRWVGVAAVAAAAAVLVLVVVPRSQAPAPVGASAAAGSMFLPELDSLSTDELESVLGEVDRPTGALRTLDSQGMGDLSDEELAGVLQRMEG